MTAPVELLTVTETGNGWIAVGEIDGQTSPQLGVALAADPAKALELDLSGVSFVDSSGLRVLIEAHQRAEQAGGRLTLVRVSPTVARLLDISGVTSYLHVDR
jgi:anti-sigma B factor antagonist